MAKTTKQPQRMLEYQHFDLLKVKTAKDGLGVKFFEKGVSSNKHSIDCEGQPHPQFTAALEQLKKYYALSLELTTGFDFARENLRDNEDALRDAIIGYDREIERCMITGIVMLGDGETAGVKITGSVKCNNNWVKIDTPKIPFAGTKLGYEQTVQKICEDIRAEVYGYVFQQKRAQQDLLQQSEEAENDEQGMFKSDNTD